MSSVPSALAQPAQGERYQGSKGKSYGRGHKELQNSRSEAQFQREIVTRANAAKNDRHRQIEPCVTHAPRKSRHRLCALDQRQDFGVEIGKPRAACNAV